MWFEIVDLPNYTMNPDIPVVVPVTSRSSEIIVPEINVSLNPEWMEEAISQQSEIISSFTLGLNAYINRDFASATRQLETARITLEEAENFESENSKKKFKRSNPLLT